MSVRGPRLRPSAPGGPGWRVVAAGWRSLRLVLGVDNLADAAVYEQCGLPRAGRTLRLAVTLD